MMVGIPECKLQVPERTKIPLVQLLYFHFGEALRLHLVRIHAADPSIGKELGYFAA